MEYRCTVSGVTESGVRAELPRVRTIPDNPIYAPYERSAEEVIIVGRIRWFAREIRGCRRVRTRSPWQWGAAPR